MKGDSVLIRVAEEQVYRGRNIAPSFPGRSRPIPDLNLEPRCPEGPHTADKSLSGSFDSRHLRYFATHHVDIDDMDTAPEASSSHSLSADDCPADCRARPVSKRSGGQSLRRGCRKRRCDRETVVVIGNRSGLPSSAYKMAIQSARAARQSPPQRRQARFPPQSRHKIGRRAANERVRQRTHSHRACSPLADLGSAAQSRRRPRSAGCRNVDRYRPRRQVIRALSRPLGQSDEAWRSSPFSVFVNWTHHLNADFGFLKSH